MFKITEFDWNVLISTDKQLIHAIFIDDLLLFGVNNAKINILKKKPSFYFWMTDLKDISHYFELEIRYNQEKDMLMLLQTAYLKVVLE